MPNIEAQGEPGLRVLIPLGLGAAVPLVEGGVLRLVGIDQGLHALIGAGAVLFVVAAALAYTQLPRGWPVVAFMFVGIPLGIGLDALLDFIFFDYRRQYLPFEMGLWLAVASLPIPFGVYIARSFTKSSKSVEPLEPLPLKRLDPLDLGSTDSPDHNSNLGTGYLPGKNRTNGKVVVALSVLGLFLAAAFLAYGEFHLAAAVAFIVCGAVAVVFSRSIAEVDVAASLPRDVSPSEPVRPLTIALWGIGLMVVGLSWIAFRIMGL